MTAAAADFDPVWLLVGFFGVVAVVVLGRWVGSVNADHANFQTFLDEIRADVPVVHDDIGKIFLRPPSATASSASPRRLNELGQQISSLLKVRDVAAHMADDLRPQVAGKSSYEMQVFARKHIDGWSPEEALVQAIQQCAFDHGIHQVDVMEVFAIELRDALLPND